MDAAEVISVLGLMPHPEGGHFRETWADGGGSAIYFLLPRGERSAWHRLHERAEIWHFYAGATLELSIDVRGPGTAATEVMYLGANLDEPAERPQAVVPAGAWQSARSLGDWTLVGCTVAPPFTFDDFELASESMPAAGSARETTRPPPGS
jgi:predicted cupin superfamily sugar epimerase